MDRLTGDGGMSKSGIDAETVGAGRSYWHRNGSAPPPGGETETNAPDRNPPPSRADIVIVGGGLAGLSTALRIMERQPDADVVILDAHFPGYGASGRNGGLMSPLAAPAWLVTAASNPDHAWGLKAINARTAAAAEWARAMAPEAEVRSAELALEATGRLTDCGLREVARGVDSAGISYDLAAGRKRSDVAAMHIAAHSVHPYKLVAGLARAATGAGVRIVSNATVSRIDDEGAAGARIHLAGGSVVQARSVVVATNAYTPSLQLARPPRAKAVYNYMLATGPIDPAKLEVAISPKGFVVELNYAYAFWRIHEGRIVYGGLERLKPVPDDRDLFVPVNVARALERHLAATLGTEAELPKITDHWGGKYHVTATDLPVIRREAGSAIVLNVGYGGEGVALTMALAPLAAALALGKAPPEPELGRLASIIAETRVPVAGMARFVARVAADVVTTTVRGRAPRPARHS